MLNDRSGAPLEVADALRQLEARQIAVPAAVTDALVALRRVQAAEPAQVDAQDIRRAYLAGADQGEIDALLLADLGSTRLRSEWAQARISAAVATLNALRDSASEVFPLLRAQAEAAIGKLQAVAELDAGATVDSLVRGGKVDDAKLLAGADEVAAELNALYRLRDQYLVRGGLRSVVVNGHDCTRWRDPVAAAAHARGDTEAQQYLAGLREGCELWYPSGPEARAAGQELADAAAAAAEKKRQREHGVGATFTSW